MSFRPTEHPVLRLPSPAEMAAMDGAELRSFLGQREGLIKREAEDPLRYGYDPWTFLLADACLAETAEEAEALLVKAEARERQLAELEGRPSLELGLVGRGKEFYGHTALLAMGQNRSGKTRWAVRRHVERMTRIRNGAFCFFEASEKASINKQQSKVHEMLPPEWRNVGKEGQVAYVKWTKQNGFSGSQFTLPNSTQGFFFNYKQDVGVFEGYELDGVWFDELVPLAFLEALEFRVGQDRRLEELVTFTPVLGFTPTVGRYVSGAEVLATVRADLLPQDMVHVKGCRRGHLPLVMQCRRREACVVWFPWGSNPFGANEEVKGKLVGASLGKIKIRAYGWTDKQVNGAFPKYGAHHRMTGEQWAKQAPTVTRYLAVDPGGSKNWFIKWYGVTAGGHVIVYREWPDLKTHGEWAVSPGGADRTRLWDWRPGPAQRSEAGRGIRAYKELIWGLENRRWNIERQAWEPVDAARPMEEIEARVIDPRMGGMEAPAEDEGTSIIALMAEESVDREGRVLCPGMELIPAPASRVEETVQMINERMDFEDGEPVTILNCPKWYVVAEDCEQTDLAYQEFTGAGTEKDALKDVIDPDRYFVKADLGFVELGAVVSTRGGAY